MDKDDVFITINHIEDFCGYSHLRVGDELMLRKDPDNRYDDEAIVVYKDRDMKIGYVANSVHSVARGTYLAGRLYDRMEYVSGCTVRFIIEENGLAIAKISKYQIEKQRNQ